MSVRPAGSHTYFWGLIHIPPTQSGSLAHDMWMMGKAMMGMPGLITEVAAQPARETQPWGERIVDQITLRFMGAMAVGAVPFWLTGTGIVFAFEKVVDLIEILPGMKAKIEQFGRSLEEQQRIIQAFGPLLELADKIEELITKTKQKTEETKKNTQALEELAVSYPPNVDMLEKVSLMITRVETVLKTPKEMKGVEVKNFETRAKVLKQIEEEERQFKELAAELLGIIERVEKKEATLRKQQEEATQRAEKKGDQIDVLQKSVGAKTKENS